MERRRKRWERANYLLSEDQGDSNKGEAEGEVETDVLREEAFFNQPPIEKLILRSP